MKHPASKVMNNSPYRLLPCRRCGKKAVGLLVPKSMTKLEISDLKCSRCLAVHYLLVRRRNGKWHVNYDRYTRRYPLDNYGEFPDLRIELRGVSNAHVDEDDAPFPKLGPISVYKRKHFSKAEVRQVWLQSDRKCFHCGTPWKLHQRSRKGWHIDHLIPNIGGGKETEMMENFRVACATCNLKKGRGYTERVIRDALQSLFD